MLDTLRELVSFPLIRFLNIADPFSLPSLMGAFLTAAAVFVLARPRRMLPRLRAFARAAFPARIFRHPSSLIDYKMFFVTSFLFWAGIVEYFITSEMVSGGIRHALTAAFGPSRFESEPSWLLTGLVTVGYVLIFDLGYWVAHWILHRIPAMWEFHKVHHSAEVLTPFTEWRQHPVEVLLFPLANALAMGGFYGLAGYALGPAAQELTLFHLNILLLLFMMTILHLRHSHLWIPARGWLGYVIQSPAHHQIHHSTDTRHFDKNLGLCLSVWDWAFGTLYIPDERERLAFGIGEEGHEHRSLVGAYWGPLVKAARALLGPRGEAPEAEAAPIQAPHPAAGAPAGPG
ncbi:sterol desaturase family protein [Labrys wisconsinensis]|uniref:Sterol desaturase/sphingolipid hydroxylase (Fatty acid hydroxylase superfamily) n=1 Tax=Labrys wisconsinensis TaxID=425677 RepID=A0ABU0JMH2_9HYPH|nr:sterol desaturase family protein [Labrys wisconsinensis]MDQ0474825.1 sterol desaturase/sphingolipid hydroxylase (fatty acid hydroxylase superfamily) [Labrys wisconsinensis]